MASYRAAAAAICEARAAARAPFVPLPPVDPSIIYAKDGNNTLSGKERTTRYGPLQYEPKGYKTFLRPMTPELNMAQNHKHVLKLYRKIVRSVPRVLIAYQMNGGPSFYADCLYNIRQHFERNRHVSDEGVAAILRHKTEMDIKECLLMWKTTSGINTLFCSDNPISMQMKRQQVKKNNPHVEEQSAFLNEFYQG